MSSVPQSPSEQPYPSYFRRERKPSSPIDPTGPPDRDSAYYDEPGAPAVRTMGMSSGYYRPISPASDPAADEQDQVRYEPLPEKRRLGYLSTAALIINKMIGTGIFSTPSSVLQSTGSKGGAIMLWVAGALMTLTSLFVYLEFGLALPLNGGELIYLEKAYPYPRYLAICVFSVLFVLLANTSANAIAFSQYIIMAFEPDNPIPDQRLQKFVALVCITIACLIHLFSRKMGLLLNNSLAIYKVILLVFVALTGFACLAGARTESAKLADNGDDYGVEGLENAFVGSSENPYNYANAMLGVLFSYQGWENANYVLAEVKRPKGDESKTFKRAVLVAFVVVSTLYILANVAFFAASSVQELTRGGVSVGIDFFIKVYGPSQFVKRGLRVLIALSSFGTILAVTYSNARVKQEIAKKRLVPFSRYWARSSPYGTPVGALTLHWIFTALVIIATPNSSKIDAEAYSLQSRIFTYGHTWAGAFISIGILILNRAEGFSNFRPQVVSRPVLIAIALSSAILNIFIIALLWWPTPGDIPWYVTPVAATGTLALGVIYWFGFAKVSPALGWKVREAEETLVDGTRVVTYTRYKEGFAKKLDDFRKGRPEAATSGEVEAEWERGS
ncbi:hypothetical protein RUND412_008848 [Rhizina undulata]